MAPLTTRLFYGAGGAVYAVKEAAYNMFVLLFYTQVLGLNGTLTGLIIALSLLWDAISDPLIGALSDRLRSPRGRRHPFMDASILPMGIGFIGLFSPPAVVTEPVASSPHLLALWLLFWSLWVRTFVTTFSIPNLALATDISHDYQGRSQVLGTRLAVMFLFSVLLPAAALLLIFQNVGDQDGRFLRGNYPLYGALSCLICWVMGTVCSLGTRRYAVPSDGQGQPSGTKNLANLTRDLLRTLNNRSFRYLLGYDIAMMASYGIVSALNMIVWTYYWQFDSREISIILSLSSLLAVGLVMASLTSLGRRFEKHQLLRLAAIGLILNCLWLYPAHMLGLLPADQPRLLFALNLLLMLIFMYFFLLRAIHTQSIIADITDEHDWRYGLRQEASFFAANNFAGKTATVFGPLYGGIAIDIVGLKAGALPGEVSVEVLNRLVYVFGLGVLPGMLIALFFAMKINLDRRRVKELQRLIRGRNGEAQSAAHGALGVAAPDET